MSAKERARLKSIVSLLKPVGLGVIIRTEAEGQTEAEIQEDLEILLENGILLLLKQNLLMHRTFYTEIKIYSTELSEKLVQKMLRKLWLILLMQCTEHNN